MRNTNNKIANRYAIRKCKTGVACVAIAAIFATGPIMTAGAAEVDADVVDIETEVVEEELDPEPEIIETNIDGSTETEDVIVDEIEPVQEEVIIEETAPEIAEPVEVEIVEQEQVEITEAPVVTEPAHTEPIVEDVVNEIVEPIVAVEDDVVEPIIEDDATVEVIEPVIEEDVIIETKASAETNTNEVVEDEFTGDFEMEIPEDEPSFVLPSEPEINEDVIQTVPEPVVDNDDMDTNEDQNEVIENVNNETNDVTVSNTNNWEQEITDGEPSQVVPNAVAEQVMVYEEPTVLPAQPVVPGYDVYEEDDVVITKDSINSYKNEIDYAALERAQGQYADRVSAERVELGLNPLSTDSHVTEFAFMKVVDMVMNEYLADNKHNIEDVGYQAQYFFSNPETRPFDTDTTRHTINVSETNLDFTNDYEAGMEWYFNRIYTENPEIQTNALADDATHIGVAFFRTYDGWTYAAQVTYSDIPLPVVEPEPTPVVPEEDAPVVEEPTPVVPDEDVVDEPIVETPTPDVPVEEPTPVIPEEDVPVVEEPTPVVPDEDVIDEPIVETPTPDVPVEEPTPVIPEEDVPVVEETTPVVPDEDVIDDPIVETPTPDVPVEEPTPVIPEEDVPVVEETTPDVPDMGNEDVVTPVIPEIAEPELVVPTPNVPETEAPIITPEIPVVDAPVTVPVVESPDVTTPVIVVPETPGVIDTPIVVVPADTDVDAINNEVLPVVVAPITDNKVNASDKTAVLTPSKDAPIVTTTNNTVVPTGMGAGNITVVPSETIAEPAQAESVIESVDVATAPIADAKPVSVEENAVTTQDILPDTGIAMTNSGMLFGGLFALLGAMGIAVSRRKKDADSK